MSTRGLAIVAALVLAGWLAVVFGGGLARVDAVSQRAAERRAEIEVLKERLEAGRNEVALTQTESFLRLQARAHGMGEPGERAFARHNGAPSPRPITPLGGQPQPVAPASPLEEWLELLFG